MDWITPVTDRQYSDIINARNVLKRVKIGTQTVLPDLKGCLNFSDLNRIENNIGYLAEKLNISVNSKTNWIRTDIPIISDRTNILSNASSVSEKFKSLYPNYQINDVPEKLSTYSDFNQLEELSLQIFDYIGESPPTPPEPETPDNFYLEYSYPDFVTVQERSGDNDRLYSFFQQYLVPDYFESVTQGNGYISCFYHGEECARIYANHSTEEMRLNGQIVMTQKIGYSGYWSRAVITENAVIFVLRNSFGEHQRGSAVITRTKDGKPVFFYNLNRQYSPTVRDYDGTERDLPATMDTARFTAGVGCEGISFVHSFTNSGGTATIQEISDISGLYLPIETPSAWDSSRYIIVTDINNVQYLHCCQFLLRM